MASAGRAVAAFAIAVALGMLAACAGASSASRPTVRPQIRITPAPAQDVPATATAFARRSVPTATPPGLYIVKAGDTLSRIADEFQTTIDEIMTLNSLADPNLIEVGQTLRIPQTPPSSEGLSEESGSGAPPPEPEAAAPTATGAAASP